jgi:hypothetical protein
MFGGRKFLRGFVDHKVDQNIIADSARVKGSKGNSRPLSDALDNVEYLALL